MLWLLWGGKTGQKNDEEAVQRRAEHRDTEGSEGRLLGRTQLLEGPSAGTVSPNRPFGGRYKGWGGPRRDHGARLIAMERRNQRLERIVADQAVDIDIPKEA